MLAFTPHKSQETINMKLANIVAAILLHGQASFGATIVNQNPMRARRHLEICGNDDNLVLASGEELDDREEEQFVFDEGGTNELSVRLRFDGNVLFFEGDTINGDITGNLWRSDVIGDSGVNRVLRMQGNGNLVVVDNPSGDADNTDPAAPETILYETGTGGNPGAELRIDVDNQRLVIVNNLDGECETIRFFVGTPEMGNTECQGGCSPVAESDLGRYQIVRPLVNYNPNDGNPTDATSNPINSPTVLIGMEHDDVTGVLGNAPFGSIQLRHFRAGCTEEILVDTGTALGEDRQNPIPPVDPTIVTGAQAAAPAVTGLNGDYNFVLQDGAGTLNGVLTIIRYPVDVLTNEAAGITETDLTTGVSTTRFCTRLELVNGSGRVRGFRSVDVTLRFSQNNFSDLIIDTVEDTIGEVPDTPTDLGAFSVRLYRAEPDDLTTEIFAGNAGAVVNQGEQFTIALVPQADEGDGTVTDTTVVNIVSVESCVFFIDSVGGSAQDPGDTFDLVISNNNAADNVEGFRCEESVFGNDIVGCVFSVGLGAEFFNVAPPGTGQCSATVSLLPGFLDDPPSFPDTTVVNGQCIVMLEFQGARRRVQASFEDGQEFSLATSTGILVENNFVPARCFVLFCGIRFMACFALSILERVGLSFGSNPFSNGSFGSSPIGSSP